MSWDGVRDNDSGDDEERKEAGRRAGDANRERKMRQVAKGNPEARAELFRLGRHAAWEHEDLVSDDVWDYSEGIDPRERRIMGVVMKDLQRSRIITPTNPPRTRKAHRKVNNSRPQLIWISLIWWGRDEA